MIAVDTNVLVYAHRSDSQHHERAIDTMRALAEGTASWAIPWPCLHEFLAIATHPRIFDPPTKMERALEQVDAWLGSPSVTVLAEGVDHWSLLKGLVVGANVRGPMVHDARIAGICLAAGVSELLTSDRDFSRFHQLRTRNPLG